MASLDTLSLTLCSVPTELPADHSFSEALCNCAKQLDNLLDWQCVPAKSARRTSPADEAQEALQPFT
jgi:hypothetical protein